MSAAPIIAKQTVGLAVIRAAQAIEVLHTIGPTDPCTVLAYRRGTAAVQLFHLDAFAAARTQLGIAGDDLPWERISAELTQVVGDAIADAVRSLEVLIEQESKNAAALVEALDIDEIEWREPCPGDPTHLRDSHAPGGAFFGVDEMHGKELL